LKDFLLKLKPYQDGAGLTQPPPPGTGSNNGARYTAESVAAAERHGLLDDTARKAFVKTYRYLNDPNHPGILWRNPANGGGHQAHDDIIGRIHAGHILDDLYPMAFLVQSNQVKPTIIPDPTPEPTALKRFANDIGPRIARIIPYFSFHHFNNVHYGTWHFSSWMGKFPFVFAHAQFAMKEKPNFIRTLWWAGTVIKDSFASKTNWDAWVLSWHLVKVFRRSKVTSPVCNLASKWFSYRLKKVHPLGIGECIWANHPNSEALMGDYG